MREKLKMIEVPPKVHAKVKVYCGKMGFKIKAFVAKVLLDAVKPVNDIAPGAYHVIANPGECIHYSYPTKDGVVTITSGEPQPKWGSVPLTASVTPKEKQQ